MAEVEPSINLSPKTSPTVDSAVNHPKSNSKLSRKETKIGHRRATQNGIVTYRKIETSQIMGSIQLGLQHSVSVLASKPERDLLSKDFMTVELNHFPGSGSSLTPAHRYSDFYFETYAPLAFRYFRDLFHIFPADFLMSMCSVPMRELSNPGASGSIFYVTHDDKYIVKTVETKECGFLQRLLPGYYMNLQQNAGTLLPRFYGLFCYRCNSKNIRLVVMNNLLPSTLEIHQKYDVKGSTYKRKASKAERAKTSPTFKDLDFIKDYPNGIHLNLDIWQSLLKTLERDTRVLESFEIMDYSLLIAVHKISNASHPDNYNSNNSKNILSPGISLPSSKTSFSVSVAQGIPGRDSHGNPVLLFLGLIDILQSYGIKKKVEHTFKALLHDGDTVSVHRPEFYAERFMNFTNNAFRKSTKVIKHGASKKRHFRKRSTIKPTEGVIPVPKVVIQNFSSHASLTSTASMSISQRSSAVSFAPSQSAEPDQTTDYNLKNKDECVVERLNENGNNDVDKDSLKTDNEEKDDKISQERRVTFKSES